jgi:capsular exopolysaccharide synthesis family protein
MTMTHPDDAAPPRTLEVEYSRTRVVSSAATQLRRVPGIVTMDRSPLSDSYRILRAQVLQRLRALGHNLLAVTSPRDHQSKTLTAVNLALCMAAEADKTVLLIDGNLSSPNLHNVFGLEHQRGLGDYLTGESELADLLINPGIDRLVVMPAGPPVINSCELLAIEGMAHLMGELKRRYQDRYVIFDLPPLFPSADTLTILPKMEATLLVVDENKTMREDLEAAAELLAPFNLIGTVLKKADPVEASARREPWYRRLRASKD